MKIVFATNNKHKLSEVKEILGSAYDVVSLDEIGCHVDIPETGNTLEENAHLKAKYVFEHYGLDCFADDTGLEVEALHGEPGVRVRFVSSHKINSHQRRHVVRWLSAYLLTHFQVPRP